MGYLSFIETQNTGKTLVFDVLNSDEYKLGEIIFRPQWRTYVFCPQNAIFDAKCLNEIMIFLNKLMEDRNNGKGS